MSNSSALVASESLGRVARWRLRRAQKKRLKSERRTTKRAEKKRRRQQLQSKLTRSYLWVTLAAVLAIEVFIGAIAALLVSRPAFSPGQTATQARRLATALEASKTVSQPKNVSEFLSQWPHDRLVLVVTDARSVVLAAAPENALRAGVPLRLQPLEGMAPNSIFALTGPGAASTPRSWRADDGGSMALVPLRKFGAQPNGWLWVRSTPPPHPNEFWRGLLGTIFVSAIIVGIFGSVVGAGFGWFTARRLTRRLEAIEAVTTAWGRGEFEVQAVVDAPDEIGQLAQRLNAMADELRELVVLRQNLATAHERNRLARDLHDTVKQQVFATAMQIGAAKVLLERDVNAVRERLETAELLARGAQSELTAILEQLRPGSYQSTLEGAKSLDTDSMQIIESGAREWARQSGIALEWRAESAPLLADNIGQTLQRIVQEALSNVARHSNATRVQIQWTFEADQRGLRLQIGDNGCGFEVQSASSGMGLSSMRERAESLPHGRFNVQSELENGTRLEVRCGVERLSS